jgi:hypothetical protein
MAHYLFNVTGADAEQAASRLRAKRWPIGDDERHRDELTPGDLVLRYVATSREFIGRAELATAVDAGGVVLSHVEAWDPAVTMEAVVERIDPTGSNPYVQANATHGFPFGVVEITGGRVRSRRRAQPRSSRNRTLRRNGIAPDRRARQLRWTSSTRTPPMSLGWTNAIVVPRDPGLGRSSISRTPAPRSRSSALATSSTR